MGAGGWEAAWKPIWLSSFFSDSPLKNMIDGNLVFLCPPGDIINKRAYPTLDLLWVRVLSRWNGRWMTGGSAESHLIVVHLFYSPLKKMIGQKNSLSALPWWYHLKRSVPDIRLAMGKRSIVSRNGRRRTMGGGSGRSGRRPWFPCCENIEWFQMCTFFNRADVDVSGAKILTHHSN
jgi:hypothetical protein